MTAIEEVSTHHIDSVVMEKKPYSLNETSSQPNQCPPSSSVSIR